jgi:hypothetical protein
MTRLFVRAVFGFLRRRIRDRGVTGGRGGAVVVVQRFGGALNVNVHLHPLPALTTAVVADVLATIGRVADWLARNGKCEVDCPAVPKRVAGDTGAARKACGPGGHHGAS